ncbi:MAG: hypothetical protein LBG65_07755 [Puniceicoccales bacterium]|jgi:hypothetical protein|nr:hypothetical protein [Puniceicoccales bacterium]
MPDTKQSRKLNIPLLLSGVALMAAATGAALHATGDAEIQRISKIYGGCYGKKEVADSCPEVSSTSFPVPNPAGAETHRSACIPVSFYKKILEPGHATGIKDPMNQVEYKCPGGLCYTYRPPTINAPGRWIGCYSDQSGNGIYIPHVNTCVAKIIDANGMNCQDDRL